MDILFLSEENKIFPFNEHKFSVEEIKTDQLIPNWPVNNIYQDINTVASSFFPG